MDQFTDLVSELNPIAIVGIIVGIALLVIVIRILFRKPPSHLTAFAGDSGSVMVSRKALQALIKQACLMDEWVEAARPLVKVKGQKVSAKVELRLASHDSLKEVTQRIQDRVSQLLQKSLSFEQIGDIQIVVKSFSSNREEIAATPPLPTLEQETKTSSELTPPKAPNPPKTAEDDSPEPLKDGPH